MEFPAASWFLAVLGTMLSAALYGRARDVLTRFAESLPTTTSARGRRSPALAYVALFVLAIKLGVCLSDLTTGSFIVLASNAIGLAICLPALPMQQRCVYLALVLLLVLLSRTAGPTRGWNAALVEAAGAIVSLAARAGYGDRQQPAAESTTELLLYLASAMTWSAHAALSTMSSAPAAARDYVVVLACASACLYALFRCCTASLRFRFPFSLHILHDAVDAARILCDAMRGLRSRIARLRRPRQPDQRDRNAAGPDEQPPEADRELPAERTPRPPPPPRVLFRSRI